METITPAQWTKNLSQRTHRLSDEESQREQAGLAERIAFSSAFEGTPREGYDALTARTPIHEGVTIDAPGESQVPGCWVHPAGANRHRAILFIHGGAYVLGSAKGYLGFASQIAARTQSSVFVMDYPLAPEHPFPAAVDAVTKALTWLGSQSFAEISIVGDSTGGGLSLSALLAQRPETAPIRSVVVFSPWADLSMTGASVYDPAIRDPLLQPELLSNAADQYLAGHPATDPLASPLFGRYTHLPPIAIQVGGDEILLDDAKRLATVLAKQGGKVDLDIYEGLHHVFQRDLAWLPSAKKALDDAGAFVTKHWSR